MSDIISKVIGVLLAFVLLIMTPMTIARYDENQFVQQIGSRYWR